MYATLLSIVDPLLDINCLHVGMKFKKKKKDIPYVTNLKILYMSPPLVDVMYLAITFVERNTFWKYMRKISTKYVSHEKMRDPHGRNLALSRNSDVILGVLHEPLSPRENINSMISG